MGPAMFLAVAGLALCFWAIWGGFGGFNRATIFIGPLGFVFNIVILLFGLVLMAAGFGLQIL